MPVERVLDGVERGRYESQGCRDDALKEGKWSTMRLSGRLVFIARLEQVLKTLRESVEYPAVLAMALVMKHAPTLVVVVME